MENEKQENEELKITAELSESVFQGVLTYRREDLYPTDEPPAISIQLACRMHPWLNELLEKLSDAAGAVQYKRETKTLFEAIFTSKIRTDD